MPEIFKVDIILIEGLILYHTINPKTFNYTKNRIVEKRIPTQILRTNLNENDQWYENGEINHGFSNRKKYLQSLYSFGSEFMTPVKMFRKDGRKESDFIILDKGETFNCVISLLAPKISPLNEEYLRKLLNLGTENGLGIRNKLGSKNAGAYTYKLNLIHRS
jgi:hypothetical protein